MQPNPDRYARLAVPVPTPEADRRLTDFQARLEALREECGIAELVAICGVYTSEDPGKISLTIASLGNQERGVELAKKLVQHLASDLAAADATVQQFDSTTEVDRAISAALVAIC